MILTHQYTIVL